MPQLARLASVIAFAIALLSALSALSGPILPLLAALISLIAGIGILRKRTWSAYGFALYQFAQLLLVLLLLARSGFTPETRGIVLASPLLVGLILLFWFAGKSLAASGGQSGLATPWIAVSLLTSVPLIFVQAFVIPTGSMEDTLLIGDRILVQRFPKPVPRRGDMIVFVFSNDRAQTTVKRVIGIPGDRIRLLKRVVYRNGVALQEPYVVHKSPFTDAYRDDFPGEPPNFALSETAQEMLKQDVRNGEVMVPAGKYFVLGDNRDNSLDSRYLGLIPSSDIVGTPRLIYDSEIREAGQTSGEKRALPARRWNRIFKVL